MAAWTRIRSGRLDALLALVVLVVVELGVWLQDELPGGKPLSAGALAVAALALAERRRRPLATLGVVVGAIALPALVAWEAAQAGTEFVALLVAAYSVARWLSLPRGALGLVVALAGTIGQVLLDPGVHTLDEATWQETTVAAAWLVGLTLRNRALREDALRARAALLEREREERARAAVGHERARIARELHDVVAHSISVIAVQAGAALEVLGQSPERARQPLATIEASAREALGEMRRLLGVLRTDDGGSTLAPQPGLAELPVLVEHVRRAGLQVELRVVGSPRRVEPGIDLSAYRIVQEALTNTLKHAGQARADVVVRYGERSLELEILDDGAARGNGDGQGHGLVGMRERVALCGGTLDAGPSPAGGFSVRARLPLGPAPPDGSLP
jgi:signal transduction histidine kinase